MRCGAYTHHRHCAALHACTSRGAKQRSRTCVLPELLPMA